MAVLAISGTTPEVDRVILRRDKEIPSGSIAIFIASRTFSKLYNGSPIPINTMLDRSRAVFTGFRPVSGHSFKSSRANITWPIISPAVRLRTSFCVPV